MWPNSVLGTRRRREQRRPDAGPERQQHHDALAAAAGTEAHLGDAGRIGVVQESRDRALQPRAEAPGPVEADPAASMLAAVRATPCLTTQGTEADRALHLPKRRSISTKQSARRSGVDGCGVGKAAGGADEQSPVATSTGAALRLEPPVSSPSRVMRHCQGRCRYSSAAARRARGAARPAAAAAPSPRRRPRHQHHQRRERVDVGTHAEADLGEDHHRQRARARPGDELEITRSSQDSVKASSQPARMAGKISGSVMRGTLSPAGRRGPSRPPRGTRRSRRAVTASRRSRRPSRRSCARS
jgi:hypothetical protein